MSPRPTPLNVHYAWILHKDKVFFSQISRSGFQVTSSVQKLIQEVFEKFHDQSFFILRNTIFTTQEADPATQSMVKVVAKRVRYVQPIDQFTNLQFPKYEMGSCELFFGPSTDQERSLLHWQQHLFNSKSTTDPMSSRQIKNLFEEISQGLPRGPVLHDFHRPIVSALLDEQNRIVQVHKNTNARSKSLHAEVNLVQTWYRRHEKLIPSGYKIYVSLKPCRMCADLIWHCTHPDVPIFYFENDPGRLAKGSQIEDRMIFLK